MTHVSLRIPKIIVTDFSDPSSIREVSDAESAQYNSAFVFPSKAKSDIVSVVNQRAALKKALDDSMSLVYVLRNKYAYDYAHRLDSGPRCLRGCHHAANRQSLSHGLGVFHGSGR